MSYNYHTGNGLNVDKIKDFWQLKEKNLRKFLDELLELPNSVYHIQNLSDLYVPYAMKCDEEAILRYDCKPDELMGFLQLSHMDSIKSDYGTVLFIEFIHIFPQFRRKGLARELIRHVEDYKYCLLPFEIIHTAVEFWEDILMSYDDIPQLCIDINALLPKGKSLKWKRLFHHMIRDINHTNEIHWYPQEIDEDNVEEYRAILHKMYDNNETLEYISTLFENVE
jgi:hypothetical protein